MDLQKGGALAPLSRLILEHFSSQLEVALRSAFEEVVGSSLPAVFVIDIGTAPHTASKEAQDKTPRKVVHREGPRPEPAGAEMRKGSAPNRSRARGG